LVGGKKGRAGLETTDNNGEAKCVNEKGWKNGNDKVGGRCGVEGDPVRKIERKAGTEGNGSRAPHSDRTNGAVKVAEGAKKKELESRTGGGP